ncbi:MAG: helix-turn-helix domain-containing protein [Paludibacteraceae bacterium]|nr:helix-turn-helix domain-containing protein [Paludibacteraceae bacterium]
MKRTLLPKYQRMLTTLGNSIRMARLRRDLSSEQIAERAGIARNTLIKIEHGDEGVAMGYYFRVLIALNLADDILLLAKDDAVGRAIQDAQLVIKERASKKNSHVLSYPTRGTTA